MLIKGRAPESCNGLLVPITIVLDWDHALREMAADVEFHYLQGVNQSVTQFRI